MDGIMRRISPPPALPSKQVTKAFLTDKAMEFILKSQKIPCTRTSRRKAARELAKRFIKNMRAEKLAEDAMNGAPK